jgi:hypothetical protein
MFLIGEDLAGNRWHIIFALQPNRGVRACEEVGEDPLKFPKLTGM